MNFAQKIFSVKNDNRKTHKIITIAGLKLKVKRDGIQNLKQKIEDYKIMHDPSLYVGIPNDITLQLMFNNDCNCRCKFCNNYMNLDKPREVIPDKWLYEYFKPIYNKTKNLLPCYGEVTYAKEGYEFLSYISQNYPHINIFIETNGIAFNEKWRKLAVENLFNVNFSVNAIDEKSFKKTVWEKDGIYTLVHNNIEKYINALDANGLSAFRPSISSVLNSTNYQNVEAFVLMALEWHLQKIIFFFDSRENNINNLSVKDKENFDKALITLLELEKLLKDKVRIGFRLFMPVKNINEYEEKVKDISIDELKEKYSKIWDLAKDLDVYKTYLNRLEVYKAKKKKVLTFYEYLTGVTWHQKVYKDKSVCENAWNHIRLRPDGRLEICAWRGYRDNYRIQNFIEKDKVNFIKLFNDLYHRKLRQNFIGGGYFGCMKNCPATRKLSQAEFSRQYCTNELLENKLGR